VQLTLQDLLDNRFQAEEPSLGFDSAIPTKKRKQNEQHQTTNQALQHMGAVVFPWEVLYEFGRMICLGFMVTFSEFSPNSVKQQKLSPAYGLSTGGQNEAKKRARAKLAKKLIIEHAVSDGGTPTVACGGSITMETAGQFRSEIKTLAPKHKFLMADLGGIDFVDSEGLGSILGTCTFWPYPMAAS
jgi:hypothetical protein